MIKRSIQGEFHELTDQFPAVLMLGPRQCGKTTLARLLNGGLEPTSGAVLVNGLSTDLPEHQRIIKQIITLILSDPENQLVTSTVTDEITFSLQAQGLEEDEIWNRTEEVLAAFQLTEYRQTHPFYLSVGEQIRVLMAAALARKPKFLVLDEISSMMDSGTRCATFRLLADIRKRESLGIVYLTHRLDDLLDADRILVLKSGEIQTEGTPANIFSFALTRPDWHMEVPLIYQVFSLIPKARLTDFPEIVKNLSGFLQ